MNQKRVVYVGETHTSYADHLLQYRIIQGLHALNPQLAIGMEMFPASSQNALDAYISSETEMTEAEFLKESHYFQVWRYDWRLFRNIFNFARKNNIPIIGLNIERKSVSKVYKDGHTDNLDDGEKKLIPKDRNLDMAGYQQRLGKIHAMHNKDNNNGFLPGFVQAQAIWDETMAEAISSYLKENPQKRMVVLAGSQHTRKDSGIPPRVARRINIPQASIVNIGAGHYPDSLADEADFFLLAEEVKLTPKGKIGIILSERKTEETTALFIESISPHSKAGEAGLKKDDQLLSINDIAIHEMEDIKISMLDSYPGKTIKVTIQRLTSDQTGEEMTFEVVLSSLRKKPMNHP